MDLEEAAMDILQPVIESAVYLASHYCRACGRNVVTAMDMQYGIKYAARNVLGTKTGSLFPEDDSSELDSEDDLPELVSDAEDDEEPFTRYEGDDKTFIEINECFDTWETWEPVSPAEILLKNAIDKNGS